jgi:16S rRNA C967 or C1407 C5-methylase (RsmB/RsmF family)/NOL1/NOP2/fmu family ribosome biogenesis protein
MPHLPQTFLDSIASCPGFDEASFTEAHEEPSPTSIRLNPFKKASLDLDLGDPVPWNSRGFYLASRPNFTHDILFQAGCYYVQEAGSMFIEKALRSCVDFSQQLSVFDVCASPGGKSTLLNSLMTKESVLVANEVVKPRAEVLAQNLAKWGTCNVVVTNNDPTAYSEMEDVFDVIVVDAPCSGSGLFRKQHDAVDEWSLDNVNLCSQRQKRILADIIPTLKPGGTLLYSTCSYSKSENEDIADWLISDYELNSVQIPLEESWGIVETQSEKQKAFGYRFYPGKTRSEGFFCAVFKKPGVQEERGHSRKSKQENFVMLKPKEKEVFKNWIGNIDEHEVIKFKEDYLLANAAAINFVNRYPHLYLKKVGSNMGSVIKNELIPHHDLAWSIYKAEGIQGIECTQEEALKFLKKELQTIEGDKGWSLMRYKGFGIGWIKNLGNRINNYLPNEFRILK